MKSKQINFGFKSLQMLLFILLLLPGVYKAQEDVKKALRLEELTEEFKFFGRAFRGGTWAEEGPIIYYTEFDRFGRTLFQKNLFRILGKHNSEYIKYRKNNPILRILCQ